MQSTATAEDDEAPPALALDEVEIGYGRRSVVHGLSLRLARGRIGCLLGPSGCGKSTVLRAVAGFEPVRAGRIRLGGETVSAPGRQRPPEQRRVGMVFQDHALFPHLTVAANVGFGLRGMADAAGRVARLLDTVGLAAQARRFPHELSGGQQQRVALARALAPAPALLLLDEPFSSLDAGLRERLGAELRALLQAQGTTALLVTHDQQEAFAIADEIGVMAAGRLAQWDAAAALYHRPRSRFVADFIGQGAFLPGELGSGGEVRLEIGCVPSAGPAGGAPGAPVDVLLRPDGVVPDAASPYTARVLAKAFRGADCVYTLQLASGATVLSRAPSSPVPSRHEPAVGERIGIRLRPEPVVAFPRGAASATA